MPQRRSTHQVAKYNRNSSSGARSGRGLASAEASRQALYPPLGDEPDSFRLLQINASSERDSELVCSLFTTTLAEWSGKFIACSYEWGSPETTTTININQHSRTVRANLDAFLRTARARSKTRVFWIDAMCINQDDFTERNRQVRMMGDIYRSAERVWAWLGPGTEESDYLFLSANKHTLTGRLAPQAEGKEFEDLQKAFCDFDDRSYWTRLWIIQELVLAQHIDFLCGLYIIPWQALQGTRKRCAKQISDSHQTETAFRAYTSLHFIDEHRRHPEARSLESLFYDFKHLECTVMYDKVFALVGMVTEESQRKMLQDIVDYNMSPHQLLGLLVQSCNKMLPLDYLHALSSNLCVDLNITLDQATSPRELHPLSLSLKNSEPLSYGHLREPKHKGGASYYKYQAAQFTDGSVSYTIFIDILTDSSLKGSDTISILGGYNSFKSPRLVLRREKDADESRVVGFALDVPLHRYLENEKWHEWRSLLASFVERSKVIHSQGMLLQTDFEILRQLATWLLNKLENFHS